MEKDWKLNSSPIINASSVWFTNNNGNYRNATRMKTKKIRYWQKSTLNMYIWFCPASTGANSIIRGMNAFAFFLYSYWAPTVRPTDRIHNHIKLYVYFECWLFLCWKSSVQWLIDGRGCCCRCCCVHISQIPTTD